MYIGIGLILNSQGIMLRNIGIFLIITEHISCFLQWALTGLGIVLIFFACYYEKKSTKNEMNFKKKYLIKYCEECNYKYGRSLITSLFWSSKLSEVISKALCCVYEVFCRDMTQDKQIFYFYGNIFVTNKLLYVGENKFIWDVKKYIVKMLKFVEIYVKNMLKYKNNFLERLRLYYE